MKNMKIKFIVPSWHYYADPMKHQPYWELYYATHVKLGGYDVSIFESASQTGGKIHSFQLMDD